ncbi:HD domain-containing protein [Marinilabilia sp.]|uniref:HD domain-containing protein n=1 Tax=Marinilabilia sp. TaxID=2021252 RepID=UPI0025C2D75E|nr:HD domain-containing protein [Marinilabilia sp.]
MNEAVIEMMIYYFGTDVSRINHALKVYGFATCIAHREKLPENKLLIVDTAAILHDIGVKEAELKHKSTGGKYQEMEGPPIARDFLEELEMDNEIIDRVCHIIGNHHSYQKIDDTDFQIIVEADFLVNIYEEKMSDSSIKSIRQKYFKTKTGISMIKSMYIQ